MAGPAGLFVFPVRVHAGVASGAICLGLGLLMTSETAFICIFPVHGLIEGDPFPFFGTGLGMTGIAGVQGLMVAYPAGI